MSRLPYSRKAAVEHLRDKCDRMSRFIDGHGDLGLKVQRPNDLFDALSESIVYQQLSGKAAGTIHGRFAALFDDAIPNASQASQLSMEQLRGVGLSRNKALAVQDLAIKTRDGTLPSMRSLSRMDDDALVDNLCEVRGIGPWTAQMFLIFNLGRPDIMPATDLGVQKGVQAVYRMRALPNPGQVMKKTRHLAPYRSAASWYFWRAADTVLMS